LEWLMIAGLEPLTSAQAFVAWSFGASLLRIFSPYQESQNNDIESESIQGPQKLSALATQTKWRFNIFPHY
jgi:hypothetical protein